MVYTDVKKMTKFACQQCGTVIKPDDKFCSSCGAKVDVIEQRYQPYAPQPPGYAVEQTKQYIKILGLVELSFGIISLFIILIVGLILGIVLSPEFLHSVGTEIPTDMSINLTSILTIVWVLLAIVGISSVIDIIGGVLLLQQKKSGKIFTYISAILSLLNVPIGTFYAIGAFWVLTKPETDEILK